jgi:ETC complex I subunit-like protein
MTARIFRPAPSAMQSGDGNSRRWQLLSDPASAREIEPLMGYTSSTDTETQVKLFFDTLEEAEAFAQKQGIPYRVQQPHESTPKRTVYSDNFRSDRKTPWTH